MSTELLGPPVRDALLAAATSKVVYDPIAALSALDATDRTKVDAALAAVDAEAHALGAPLEQYAARIAEARIARKESLTEDQIRRIENVERNLRRAAQAWPSRHSDSAEVIENAQIVKTALLAITVDVAKLTISEGLSAEVDDAPPGTLIPLAGFVDERVPADARDEIIAWIGQEAKRIPNGAVDVEKQCVWRIPKSWWWRGLRLLAPIAWASAGVATLGVAAWLAHDASDKTLARFSDWLLAFLAVLVGVALHFVAGTVQQGRAGATAAASGAPGSGVLTAIDTADLEQKRREVPVVSRWWQWIVLRPLAGFWLLMPAVVTVIVLRLLKFPVHTSDPKGLATYVFAGYSADSIAATAFSRFGTLAAAAQKSVAGKLSS